MRTLEQIERDMREGRRECPDCQTEHDRAEMWGRIKELRSALAAAESRAARWKAAAKCFWWNDREGRDALEQSMQQAEAAESQRDAAVAVLRSVEWRTHDGAGFDTCPECGRRWDGYNDTLGNRGHAPNCALAACLRGVET